MHVGCGSWRAHFTQPGILARVLTLGACSNLAKGELGVELGFAS